MKYDKLNGIIFLPSNITYLRNLHNYSQQKLADMLGYVPTTITNWEKGIRIPDVFDLKRLADLFNVSTDELLKVDFRFKDSNLTEDEKREIKRKECLNNLKKLSKEQEKEILEVVDVLVKSKMTNLSEKEE